MSVVLGSNLSSIRAQRQLGQTENNLSNIFSRLSSGLRINKASDDAAGLAISDELRATSRVYQQGIRNFGDGVSLFNIADSTLDNLIQITTRLEELAEQAANGVLGVRQREAVDQEAQALKEEFFRISHSTTFNGLTLFNGDLDQLQLQGGFGTEAILNLGVGGAIGTGEFGEANSVALAGFNTNKGLVSVDINNDGIQDLVGLADGGANAVLSIGFGDESGNFNSFSTSNVSSNFVEELDYGDVNTDGMMDLIILGRDVGGNDLSMVLLNQGNGTFGSAIEGVQNTAGLYGATGLAVGDINGDGYLDIVTTGGNGAGAAGSADVRLGDGSGNYSTLSTFNTNSGNSIDLTLGDINNDGNLDLVTVGNNLGFQAEANVQLGDGTGSFGASTKYLLSSAAKLDVELSDINNDGNLDFVSSGGSDVTVMIGDGTGAFANLATTTSGGTGAWELELGDINGDSFEDVVTSGSNTVVLLGDGAGNFDPQPSLAMEDNGSSQLTIGDFNQDGVYDIATMGIDLGGTSYITTRVASTTDGVAPLLDFSLSNMADARQALMMFKTKRELLSSQRGEIGAGISRLDVALQVLAASKENFQVAESRIRDADIAQETSALVRNGILQRAASSVLAQANQQPTIALELLRN